MKGYSNRGHTTRVQLSLFPVLAHFFLSRIPIENAKKWIAFEILFASHAKLISLY